MTILDYAEEHHGTDGYTESRSPWSDVAGEKRHAAYTRAGAGQTPMPWFGVAFLRAHQTPAGVLRLLMCGVALSRMELTSFTPMMIAKPGHGLNCQPHGYGGELMTGVDHAEVVPRSPTKTRRFRHTDATGVSLLRTGSRRGWNGGRCRCWLSSSSNW